MAAQLQAAEKEPHPPGRTHGRRNPGGLTSWARSGGSFAPARSQARPVPSGAVELGLLTWGGHAVLGVVLQVSQEVPAGAADLDQEPPGQQAAEDPAGAKTASKAARVRCWSTAVMVQRLRASPT